MVLAAGCSLVPLPHTRQSETLGLAEAEFWGNVEFTYQSLLEVMVTYQSEIRPYFPFLILR